MRTLELQQGSEAWHQHRATHHNSSEAPAMMGASSKLKRSDLVRMKATGTEKQFSQWVEEVLFERGHDVEAAARPIVERLIGEELFPATGVSDEYPQLSASFDGISMAETVVWEGKQWNETKAAFVRAGRIPPDDYWQCVQLLVVSRAERLVYTLSNGTEERTIHCELRLSMPDQKALLDGWRQFDEDVKAYQPSDVPAPAAVGRAPGALPALLVEVTGAVTQSNLPEFKARAIEVFRGIKTDLQTDADFADAEQTVKFCKDVEERLAAAKDNALSKTASIDELFRAIDEISGEARAKRLELDRLVKARKEAIRIQIIDEGARALVAHVTAINKRLARVPLPPIAANFAGVIKGLKTVASIKDAVATELARAKIEANALAEDVAANLATIDTLGKDHLTLFADLRDLVTINPQRLPDVVRGRIAAHEAEQRAAAERRAQQAQASPAPAPAAAPAKPAAKPRMRADGPTGAQIIEVLAMHYRVHESKVIEWLLRIDLKAESARMAKEFES